MAAPAKATQLSESDVRPHVEELLDEIARGDDTVWQAYTDRLAAEVAAGMKLGMYKTWSANNRMSLVVQARRRRAHVHGIYAGVDQWRKRNRTVRTGEIPYVIFGSPMYRRRVRDDANQPAKGAPNPQDDVLVYRRPPAIPVYDYTQTVSEDPEYIEPDWSAPLAGGDLATLQSLVEVSPVPVKFAHLAAKQEHGWLDATGITIDESRTIAGQIWTLAHELAHFHLGHMDTLASTRGHERDDARAKCEQEAAFAQFLTLKMLGLDETVGVDITAAAGQYLRHWAKDNADGTTTPIAGHKGRRRLLKARFDAGFKAATAIVTAYAQHTATQPAQLVTVSA